VDREFAAARVLVQPSRLPSNPAWRQAHTNSGIELFELGAQEIDDPPHEEATVAVQLGQAANPGDPLPMTGFVESYRKRQPPPHKANLVMGYCTAQSVPTFDFFARNVTVCDH
jgi:phospholipase C